MTTSLGRNAPCPCGSGKKFKQCCLRGEERRRVLRSARQEGLGKALGWLERRHGDELERALEEQFFAGVDRRELQKKLAGLPPSLGGMVEANAREWLVSEATLRLGDRELPARELVLTPGGPGLSDEERRWVQTVAATELSVYEIEEVREGEGVTLRDLLTEAAPVRVADSAASTTMRAGEVLGARVARAEEAWSFTGALYPFPRVAVPALLAELKGSGTDGSDGRERRWRTIVGQWLRVLVASPALEEGGSELVRGRSEAERAELRGRLLRETLRGFYENWADEPIPALGDRSPREAIASPEGLEAVRSLLRTYEADEAAMAAKDGRDPLDFGFLRDELGLPQA